MKFVHERNLTAFLQQTNHTYHQHPSQNTYHPDVWDTLGTNLQNVTKDVTKWNLDDRGRKQKFHGRNTRQRSLEHEKHDGKTALRDISDSNGGGELHATDLTVDNLEEFYDNHPFAMVDYYAPWCVWCQRLAPTWEKFAANVARRQNDNIVNLGVGKVDCVEHPQICKDERVMAFPTLRWHEGGKAVMPDYGGDRTAEALLEYAERRAGRSSSEGGGDDDDGAAEFDEEHHPGCQVSGHLMVNRVPGNLHVEAKSLHHEINSAMTNLTHRVNHLSFGTPNGPQGHHLNFLGIFDNDRGMLTETTALYSHANPMKDKSYPTFDFHQAYHHHLKIVSTHVDSAYHDATVVYQILEESQLVLYEVQEIPEIKFLWDMSPMSINLTNEGRRWYEYVTNLLAIIGGTYTTLGLINATLLRIFKPKRI